MSFRDENGEREGERKREKYVEREQINVFCKDEVICVKSSMSLREERERGERG